VLDLILQKQLQFENYLLRRSMSHPLPQVAFQPKNTRDRFVSPLKPLVKYGTIHWPLPPAGEWALGGLVSRSKCSLVINKL
jgi:hypothetical protein